MRPSWDVHNCSRRTHSLEGVWDTALEAKRDQCGGSLPYIGTEAFDSRSPNWSATRSSTAQGVMWHKKSYGIMSPMAQGVLRHKESCDIRSLDQERLLIQEGSAWL